MADIILHSDDFGLHESINRAIAEAALQGTLTSCSLMANGLAVDDAVERASHLPNLGVGVHLNIVRGRPLSDPAGIPTLVNESGRFFNSASKLAVLSMAGRLSAAEIYIEYKRQITFLMKKGIFPSHFDSEKHTHLWIPEAAWALREVMTEFGLQKVRLIHESPVLTEIRRSGIRVKGDPLQRIKLKFLESRSGAAQTIWGRTGSPDLSFGVSISGKPDAVCPQELIEHFFKTHPGKVIEWMFHLGYDAPGAYPEIKNEFGSFFLTGQRELETRMLLGPEIKKTAAMNRNRLISYREL